MYLYFRNIPCENCGRGDEFVVGGSGKGKRLSYERGLTRHVARGGRWWRNNQYNIIFA